MGRLILAPEGADGKSRFCVDGTGARARRARPGRRLTSGAHRIEQLPGSARPGLRLSSCSGAPRRRPPPCLWDSHSRALVCPRHRPLPGRLLSSGAPGWGVRAGSFPMGPLTRSAALPSLQVPAMLNATLRWEVSAHSTVAAMAGCVVWTLTGSPLALFFGLPAVMWSRIHLERHAPAQTLAGAALGIAIFLPVRDFLLGG